MASRGRRTQSGGETWAGFVDALSALLMVLIFALSAFLDVPGWALALQGIVLGAVSVFLLTRPAPPAH